MEELRNFISGPYSKVSIDLEQPDWYSRAKVPAKPGWYYIETTAPLDVIARQALWSRQYTLARSGLVAEVKNYDLQVRCARFRPELCKYWNIRSVYSGLATNLRSRAREHTFADPGTAGLALGRYPELIPHEWWFNYRTLDELSPTCVDPRVVLRLGEQVWRSIYGWPVLCAE